MIAASCGLPNHFAAARANPMLVPAEPDEISQLTPAIQMHRRMSAIEDKAEMTRTGRYVG